MNSSWSFFQKHDLRSLTAAAAIGLVAGLGAASLRTTIASRLIMDSLEFLVIGAPLAETLAVAAVVLAIVVGTQVWLLRRARVDPDAARSVGPARWALPLLTFLLPIAGVGAAMLGGPASGPAVYWFWEMAPWWLGCGALSAAARAVSVGRSAGRLRAATGRLPPAVRYAVLGCVVAVWTLAANPSLRSWRGPLGDEPRYLRYIESWCQGGGIDIARIAPLADVPRDGGPLIGAALASAVRTFRDDVRSFAGDVAATLRDSSYSWNRMTSGDGSFVTGRGGGSYQSHQPGLSLVLLPGYVIDRHVFSTGTSMAGSSRIDCRSCTRRCCW